MRAVGRVVLAAMLAPLLIVAGGCARQADSTQVALGGDPDVVAALRAVPSPAELVQSAETQQLGRATETALDARKAAGSPAAGSSLPPSDDAVVPRALRERSRGAMELAAREAFPPDRFVRATAGAAALPADIAAIMRTVARGLDPASGDERRAREAAECPGDHPPDIAKCVGAAAARREAVFAKLLAARALTEAGLTEYRMMRGLAHGAPPPGGEGIPGDVTSAAALARSIVTGSRAGLTTGTPPDVRAYISAGRAGPGGLAAPAGALLLLSRDEIARLERWLDSPAGRARNAALIAAYARANDEAGEAMLQHFFRTMISGAAGPRKPDQSSP